MSRPEPAERHARTDRPRAMVAPVEGYRPTSRASRLMRRRQVRYPWQLRGGLVRQQLGAHQVHVENAEP